MGELLNFPGRGNETIGERPVSEMDETTYSDTTLEKAAALNTSMMSRILLGDVSRVPAIDRLLARLPNNKDTAHLRASDHEG